MKSTKSRAAMDESSKNIIKELTRRSKSVSLSAEVVCSILSTSPGYSVSLRLLLGQMSLSVTLILSVACMCAYVPPALSGLAARTAICSKCSIASSNRSVDEWTRKSENA